MPTWNRLSTIGQIAGHLREELAKGRWMGTMPGQFRLADELGAPRNAVEAALRQLVREGILSDRGSGRPRGIAISKELVNPSIRVKILAYEQGDRQQHFLVDVLHRLTRMGYTASFASKNMRDLGMDTKRIIRHVREEEADAWMIMAGSREILEWFAEQPTPALAIAGRRRGIRIAGIGPDKIPACAMAIRRLISLGHRRIAMIVREERRKPALGFAEQAFLNELNAHGISTGPYNLPDWKDNSHDFHRCLDSLFRHTAPTALLIDEMPLFFAAQQHLAQRGILAPQDVSLICLDPHPAFAWSQPTVSHIHWDIAPISRRMLHWAGNVSQGKDDRSQSLTKAVFMEGGTMGPAPKVGLSEQRRKR
jgi:DNA-binding LacI/PurR family transcriptional regulator